MLKILTYFLKHHMPQNARLLTLAGLVISIGVFSAPIRIFAATQSVYSAQSSISDFAQAKTGINTTLKTGDQQPTAGTCGAPDQEVHISLDIGCKHKGNPILDALFAIIRFLSIGVGLVIVGSMVVAGIQFTSSRGDPQATAKAVGRIQSTLVALLIFIFAYAILNYLVPGAILK